MRHRREAALLPLPITFGLPYYFGYNNKMTFLLVLVSTEIPILVHGVFSIVQHWNFCATPFISVELHYLSSWSKPIIFHSVGDRHLSLTCWSYWPTCLLLVKDEHDHLKIFSHVAPNRRAPCKCWQSSQSSFKNSLSDATTTSFCGHVPSIVLGQR